MSTPWTSSLLFSSFKLGPILLRNRAIRAAAFEGMCPLHSPSQDLLQYHKQVAAGGIGMTTLAYAAVDKSGLSFPHQLLMRKEIIPELRKITDEIHREGAACSIQLGHGGDMAKRSVTGTRPMAPSRQLNLYGPTFPRTMNKQDIDQIVEAYGRAVHLSRESGFDAVEIHAGHGYLISQFLSPFTNKRRDEFGGKLENRSRFMNMVIERVKKEASNDLAVLVKMNMRDGFTGGMQTEESLQVAKMLEDAGVDALVLSGGFVSRSPMYILRGAMPIKTLASGINDLATKSFVRLFGNFLIKSEPFQESYFLEDALKFRDHLKMPLVYVGGLISRERIDSVLAQGFEFVAIARALIKDPDFINKLMEKELSTSTCDTCNHCIAVMYNGKVSCIQNDQ